MPSAQELRLKGRRLEGRDWGGEGGRPLAASEEEEEEVHS